MKEITKLGLMISDIHASQKSFLFIEQLNYLVNNYSEIDACLFFNNISVPCVRPNFSVIPALEVWGFHDGLIITTDIDTTLMATKACNSSKIVFYADDLEWMRPGKQDFLYNIQAYRSPLIEVIAPSIQYAKLIENYSNRKVSAVIPAYDLNAILKRFTNVNIK